MPLAKSVLIVGGGASGTLSAIALVRAGIPAHEIDIAEPRWLLGEGLAYQTRSPLHRLNVPTDRMSAIEDLPLDFVAWWGVEPYTFMERCSYGDYLRDRLPVGITHIRDFVVGLEKSAEGSIEVSFDKRGKGEYRYLVLAMGHGPARIPDFLNGFLSPRVIADVWNGEELPRCRTLLCFGTGLSFIDIALSHLERDPLNKVIALSGSGNLPERHTRTMSRPLTPTLEEVSTLEKLRGYLASNAAHWREAVDGLRPITNEMWQGFTNQEREEFLRTDGATWSRRRHRIAPDVADRMDAEIEAGRIEVHAIKASSVHDLEDQIVITSSDGRSFAGDYLALCIGRDYAPQDPLTLNLLSQNFTSRGPLGMGLAVDPVTGKLVNPAGEHYPNIYAIGPLRSGEAFESTAIPEIRKQAAQIAAGISAHTR